MKYRSEVLDIWCSSCGSVEVLLPEDPRPASHCPDCGADRRLNVRTVSIKYEPFEGKPQTRGDQQQQQHPYRIRFKAVGSGLPGLVGVNEEDARAILEDLQKMFTGPGDGATSPESDEATKMAHAIVAKAEEDAKAIMEGAESTASASIDACNKRIRELLDAAKKKAAVMNDAAEKKAGQSEPDADDIEKGEAVAVAVDHLLEELKKAEGDAKDWKATSAFGDGNSIHMKFPGGSELAIELVDVDAGAWNVSGVRQEGKKKTPFKNEGLKSKDVVSLINKIAPVFQEKKA